MSQTRRRVASLGLLFGAVVLTASLDAAAQGAPAGSAPPPPPPAPSAASTQAAPPAAPAPPPRTMMQYDVQPTTAIGAAAAGDTATGKPTQRDTTGPAGEPKTRSSIMEFDVQPTVRVLKSDEAEIRVGGLVQMFAAPYAGNDALIENNDPVSEPGFRLRRAGFGLQGRLQGGLGAMVSVNAIQSGSDADRAISTAILFWEVADPLRLTLGTVKVPYSRGALQSSRTLTGIERPLAVNLIAPTRRLGLTAEGQLVGHHVAYLVGVMNGTQGFSLGNQFGGILGGGRLEAYPWDQPDPWTRRNGVGVAADVVYGNSPSVRLLAYSADVFAAYEGVHFLAEALCDQQTPKESPILSPTLPDTLRRCGAYGEVGYVLPWLPVQPMARLEVSDDNRVVADAGDVTILDTGVNAQIIPRYVRAQLHYVGRYELKGPSRDNDAVVASLQGAF